jgi:hypothetical protein
MKKLLTVIISVVLGVAIPVAGVELFGYFVAHSLFSSSFEGNNPNLAVYGAMAIGWLPFVVLSALILGLVSPKPVWLFSGIAALITTLFYFVPSSSEGLSLPHAVVVLVVGWLIVPLSLGFSRLTRSSTGRALRRAG